MQALVLIPNSCEITVHNAVGAVRHGTQQVFRLVVPHLQRAVYWTKDGFFARSEKTPAFKEEEVLREVEVDKRFVENLRPQANGIDPHVLEALETFQEEVELILAPKSC